jgi:hypothetical protein
MTRFLCVMAAVLFWAIPASATSPCRMQTPEEFQVVKDQSDLIIHAQVSASFIGKTDEQGITWVRILNTYKGKADSDVIKVQWISDNPPLYSYKKDSEVVLLLKQKEGRWYLTDDSWKKCIPAVIGLPSEMDVGQKDAFIGARLSGAQ